jgi:hypothetical protein
MKKLLPLLLCYVFLTAQGLALSGGPVFGGGGSNTATTVGTYAGVLVPEDDQSLNPGVSASTLQNSLGVFTVGVPQVDVASGAFVYFQSGQTYVGAIVGVADPERLTFQGLVKAQFDILTRVTVPITGGGGGTTSAVVSTPGGFANGSIDCEFVPTAGFSSSSPTGSGNTAVRIRGTARLTITATATTSNSALVLNVDGYKQSATADVAADLAAFGLAQSSTGAGGAAP